MEVRGHRSFRLKVGSPEVVSPKSKSIRPKFVCRSLSLKKGLSVKRLTAHVDQKLFLVKTSRTKYISKHSKPSI